jgi:hypothetical protein
VIDCDVELIQFWGHTLYHVDDLYSMEATLYTDFMKKNEGIVVRDLLVRGEIPKGSQYQEGAQYMPTL